MSICSAVVNWNTWMSTFGCNQSCFIVRWLFVHMLRFPKLCTTAERRFAWNTELRATCVCCHLQTPNLWRNTILNVKLSTNFDNNKGIRDHLMCTLRDHRTNRPLLWWRSNLDEHHGNIHDKRHCEGIWIGSFEQFSDSRPGDHFSVDFLDLAWQQTRMIIKRKDWQKTMMA